MSKIEDTQVYIVFVITATWCSVCIGETSLNIAGASVTNGHFSHNYLGR